MWEPVELLSAATVAIFILHRRTFYRAVRAKYAAIASLRAQQRLAVGAFVEKLACFGWHRFTFSEAANGAHQHGFKENFAHPDSLVDSGRIARIPSRFGQCSETGFVRIERNTGGFLIKIHFRASYARHSLECFLDCDRTKRTAHILDIESDGL
jgi:hypothetical protein